MKIKNWLKLAGVLAIGTGIFLTWQIALPDTKLPKPSSRPAAGEEFSMPAGKTTGRPSGHSGHPTPPTASQPAAHNPVGATEHTTGHPAQKTTQYVTINNKQYPVRTYEPLATPNDPLATQWWTTNARLPEAWDIPAGSHDTLLAVIDTGFALQHEEFAGRWYTNPAESGAAATNGIDDDGNGFVDDTSGWDFADNDNSPQAGETNPAGSGTTHGSRVAGVAAATGNNGKGIAGADWHTKILPIQALDDDGYGDTLGVGQGIYYAVSMGADVISLSLGSDLPDDYVREAVQAATAAGIVVVAAAGNDGCDCMVYPANYPEVVSVGALDTNNLPAGFSSYGTNLDILAPGTQITTASWTAANPTNAYTSNSAGTSFATPLVGGLMTRMLSTEPDATPLQLIAALTENTNRLSLSSSISRSPTLGYGSLDAAKASARMVTPRSLAQAYQFTPVSYGSYLNPGSPAEAAGTYRAQACQDGVAGTTPLYELTKATGQFFSISQTEVWLAQKAGWTPKLFAEVCLQEPGDTAGTVRGLNLFKEFRNLLNEAKP